MDWNVKGIIVGGLNRFSSTIEGLFRIQTFISEYMKAPSRTVKNNLPEN